MGPAVAAALTSTAGKSLPLRLLQSDLLRSPWSTLQQHGLKVHGSDIRLETLSKEKVVRADHNQQGRGSAMIQVELSDVESGNKVNALFNTDESVETVFVEKSFTCMCTMDDEVTLIDTSTFEQMDVKRDLFGKAAAFLKEKMKVCLRLFNDIPLSESVPKRVVCTVVDTHPRVKGVSVTPVEKRALLDNSITFKVPASIETGEVMLVNTAEHASICR